MMASKNKLNKSEVYIQQYPQLKKWINQCVCCQTKGHKLFLPNVIKTPDVFMFDNLKKLFKPLELNEDGLCEFCWKEQHEYRSL